MKNWLKAATWVEIIAVLFILLFVYAATSKLIDYQKFRVQLGQSPMLTAFAGFVAWFIPSIEIIISIALAIPKYRQAGFYASFSIMTMFTAYIFVITRYSEYVPCSCGGVLSQMGWDAHFIFNIFFIVLAVIAILIEPGINQKRQIALT